MSYIDYTFEYPSIRPRRLRRNVIIRKMVGETSLEPRNLIMPIFVKEGINGPEPIPSMPSQYRYPVEEIAEFVAKLLDIDITSVIIFGIPSRKDSLGSEAYNRSGVVQRAIKAIRGAFDDKIVIFTDLCMCQYTDHGHCGIISVKGSVKYIDHEKTLEYLGRIGVSHAEAGADFVAPSGMIDGMVSAVRSALDNEGFEDIGIMSYSVKYASSFYGPFREAATSAPLFGDRRTHQMDPRNAKEALKEAFLDLNEGADIIMVKPALAYLDIIRVMRETFPIPIAAYNVSGEYSMIKAVARNGWIDEKSIVFEVLTSIKRAGADLILTYYAYDVAQWIQEGFSPF